MKNFDPIVMEAMQDALNELIRTKNIFPENFHNAHEGYAVIKEEFDELWDEIRRADSLKGRKEAVQTAAMLIQFIAETDTGDMKWK